MELKEQLAGLALELGFARFGVARAAPLERDGDALRRWIAAGHHASMRWMERSCEVRCDPTREGMLPSAKSVIALAYPYARATEGAGPVARYARGRDYHNVLGRKAKKIASAIRTAGHHARASVDTMPVLERAWAQRAGLGFIGKNCCLIVPGLGSHVLLAAIVTSAVLEPDAPMPERCGSCRLCLDACPTSAFVRERELDARRCISYLTIEHEGSIDEALREPMGRHLFGCDDCQDVCPFNRTAPADPALTTAFASSLDRDAQSILSMDEASYAGWARGRPLARPGREGLARNAALVLGNSQEKHHLPILRDRAENDPSPVVREAAAWAAARLAREQ